MCDNMMPDSIRLDGAAFVEPFNIKNYGHVVVSIIDKKVWNF